MKQGQESYSNIQSFQTDTLGDVFSKVSGWLKCINNYEYRNHNILSYINHQNYDTNRDLLHSEYPIGVLTGTVMSYVTSCTPLGNARCVCISTFHLLSLRLRRSCLPWTVLHTQHMSVGDSLAEGLLLKVQSQTSQLSHLHPKYSAT